MYLYFLRHHSGIVVNLLEVKGFFFNSLTKFMVILLNSVFWSLSREHLCSSSGFEERYAVLAIHVVLVFAI